MRTSVIAAIAALTLAALLGAADYSAWLWGPLAALGLREALPLAWALLTAQPSRA